MEQSKFYQIKNVTEHEYTIVGCDGSVITRPIQDIDKSASAFTIQDAKDGDVLATLDYILVFKEFLKNDGGISYCHYDFGAGNPQFIWSEDKNWYFGEEAIIHPATKEQRDTLFTKMKEAGYEWDAEHKQLKKIEHESVWSEEDEKRISSILLSIEYCKEQYPNLREYQYDIDWLKSLRPQKPLTNEEIEQAKKEYRDVALSKMDYIPEELTYDNGWDDAISYMKKSLRPKTSLEAS